MGGWVDGWMGGWVDGWEYRFSSLMKQNKKAEICFVINIAGFFFLNFFCYEVIVKQIFYKRATIHYLYMYRYNIHLRLSLAKIYR